MSTTFNQIAGLSQREQLVAELVARVVLNADLPSELTKALGLQDASVKQIKEALTSLEKKATQQSATLSSLLASTSKSKCCS